MAKGLTYKEFQELAMANYNKGGDTFVECWGTEEFEEYTASFGPITKTKAAKMFKENASIEHEYEEAAKWYSGESSEPEEAPEEYQDDFGYYDDYEDDDYTPSATRGDYSPSCPWNAPGMSIHDFI